MPVSRWGCALNDFMGILGQKFLTDMLGNIPFVGGVAKLVKGVWDAIEVFHHIGEFITLLFSINLCVQIFVRIVLINYYILTGPVVFACWALPGGTGQKILGQWFKGFVTLLLVQGLQVFILTTMPLLLPTFPPFADDRYGVINIFFSQLPRIIVLISTVQVPKMIGTGATRAMAQAGTVASGTVAAVGAAAYNVV